MDVTAPTLSIAAAASAAGLRPGYVRGLLSDRRIVLLARHEPARPSRACVMDAFRLRVLRVLLDAGLSEAAAIHVLDINVDPRIAALALCVGIEIPRSVLAGRLYQAAVTVGLDESTGTPDVSSHPIGYPAPPGRAVAITLNLFAICADTFAALDAPSRTAAVTPGRSRGPGGSRGGVPNPSTNAGVAPALTGVTQ